MHFHRVASQFFNTPLLLSRQSGETIAAYLHARMRNQTSAPSSAVLAQPAAMAVGDDYRPVPYRLVGGTAVIAIVGELVGRGYWMNADSGLVSYEGIKNQLLAAAGDTRVRNILLDIQSPGGEALGCFETAALVRAVNKQKPVVAIANGMAASGGYAIASAAGTLITIPSGMVGSIGVVWVHLDFSQMLENDGVKPTIITEPVNSAKGDANPYEPLSDEAALRLQRDAQALYQQFVESVARDKRMTAAAARKTNADVFIGAAAVEMGLADDVGTFEEVLAEMATA